MNKNRIYNPAYVYAMKKLAEDEFVSAHATLMDLKTDSVWFDTEYSKQGIHNALEDFNTNKVN